MDVTVAICTWNRAELLDQTLRQMRHLRIPEGVEWELLVVNNNCTDHTDEVIARYADALPIRRLFEPRPGKSNAANLAIEQADGDLILWTDDDVLVEPDWLVEYVNVAQRGWRQIISVERSPRFMPISRPVGLRRNAILLGPIYATYQFGDVVRPLKVSEFPFGANMAIRRKHLGLMRFQSELGPCGDNQVRGEETVLLENFNRAGLLGVYVGTARVRHYIPPRRMTKQYLRNWYRGYGRTMIRIEGQPAGRYLFGCPAWAIRIYGQELLKSLLFAPFKGPAGCTPTKRRLGPLV